LLRRKLGYSGIVVSDDLQMEAIEKNHSLEQAVEAGDDLLIFSNYKKPDADLPDRVISILADGAARDPLLADSIVRPSVTPGDVERQHRDVKLTVLGLNG
jgi:beta-N-acetylhexosaminidase